MLVEVAWSHFPGELVVGNSMGLNGPGVPCRGSWGLRSDQCILEHCTRRK
jgi:hypothetical protein